MRAPLGVRSFLKNTKTRPFGTVLLVVLSGHIADRFGLARSAGISGFFLSLSMLGFFVSQSLGIYLGYDLLL